MKKYIFLILFFCCGLSTASFSQNWSLTGNSGTTPPTNFIGTTDSKPLIFKTNKIERMRILATGNIGIGIAKPLQILHVNGNINMSAGSSLFIDNHKILSADFVTQNLFLGTGAGTLSITGTGNTSAGNNALYSITTGYHNTAVGAGALFSNATGTTNTAVGYSALSSNTDGFGNVASGFSALYSNTTGAGNTASGRSALFTNTTGYNNTGVGYNTLYNNSTGSNNASLGYSSLQANVSGSQNVAVGTLALAKTIASWNNTAIGYYAGGANNYGYNNSFIGAETNAAIDAYNCAVIGNGAYAAAPNTIRLGNSSITTIGGWAGWTNISDGRVKKNIKENVPGLSFINKLKPVTYNLDLDAADKILDKHPANNSANNQTDIKILQLETEARNAKQKLTYTGFIAQDVEKAARELNYDFSGVDVAKNDKDLYGLRYAEFVVPLVKAVQELSVENEKLKSEIETFKSEIAQVKALLSKQQSSIVSNSTGKIASVCLGQNFPNPFYNSTRIDYVLSGKFTSAKIIITDQSGKVLKEEKISGSGKGVVNTNLAMLPSGTYVYSLFIDGVPVETKQMIVVK